MGKDTKITQLDPDARRRSRLAARSVAFATVRKIGRTLPRVEEGTTYGLPALKVDGKMFACRAGHKSAEPNTLAVRIDFAQRDDLLAADPETYYLTYHYEDYPCILVRLARVHPDALRDLLVMARRFVSESRRSPKRRRAVRSA